MNRAKRRDANEGEIIDALQAVGAAVQRLDGDGVPDLLVEYRGVLRLIEVKLPLTARGAVQKGRHYNSRGGRGDLTPAQVKWWDAWKGTPPVIVRTPAEALAAIGAEVKTIVQHVPSELHWGKRRS